MRRVRREEGLVRKIRQRRKVEDLVVRFDDVSSDFVFRVGGRPPLLDEMERTMNFDGRRAL